jgi:hypothetical protein
MVLPHSQGLLSFLERGSPGNEDDTIVSIEGAYLFNLMDNIDTML